MRSRSDADTIPISCGHRVPRAPRRDGSRNLYWCEACSQWRMSGGKSSGLHAFDFLLELRELIQRHGVTVPDPGTEHGRAAVAALGARIEPARIAA